MPKNYINKYLSDSDLDEIVKNISQAESKTSGEIRLSIKTNRGYREKGITPRELAITEFHNLDMHKTKDKTGVLFFILFDEHKFEIIADEGINSKIEDSEWKTFSEKTADLFREEKYKEGIKFVIDKIGERLAAEFPVQNDDKNELSNEVIIS